MIEIIPAIDIIEGKCVRLTQGDYAQKKIYNEDTLEVALKFEDAGIKRLHLVDLDGAKKGSVVNWKVLEKIAGKTQLKIDFGGGVKSDKEIEIIFNAGASFAAIGSVAVKSPELLAGWILKYGGDKILLGADVRDEKISISGWLENTDVTLFDFIENYSAKGINNFFCTDISKDGLMQGPSTELYKKVITEFPKIDLIASGGVSNIDDVHQLNEIGCSGVIIGKAIYEGSIELNQLKPFL